MKSSRLLTTLMATALLAASTPIAIAGTNVGNRSEVNRSPARVNPQPLGGSNQFAAPGGGGRQVIVTTCDGASSCNDFIALCAASGGDFTPIAHDGEGRPIKGECKN
ncbi:MAG: hypothetical protein HY785_05545 [Oscillatoriophycideae cyanobacterium NC_groundwater_1537_Pr4_S-0.65um_50_18]|nr:hypothetical protein [Oscillatoriophycideae cyanobacterium NC_groundwater_1537_Pr4_S-0.65um_50_18]